MSPQSKMHAWVAIGFDSQVSAEPRWTSGTNGWIDIPKDIFNPNEFTLYPVDGAQEFAVEPIGNGFTYEVAEVFACIRDGLTESRLVPLDDTLLVMRLLDRIRSEIELVYPSER